MAKTGKPTSAGQPVVGILMGSESDLPTMELAAEVLKEYGIPFEMRVLSAHRNPHDTAAYADAAEAKGLRVLIAGAGGAAHLAGTLAARTVIPVIGVPIETPLGGVDSLLSTVQMPKGVPVATVAIGKAGARNAGLLAVQILGTGYDERLRERLKAARRLRVSRSATA